MFLDWFRKPVANIAEPERPVLAVVVDQLRELRHRQDQLELAWTDILDKLVAREERERKRLSKVLKARVAAEPEPEAESLVDDRSARLRAIRKRVAATQRSP